jgi:hypothetical protein
VSEITTLAPNASNVDTLTGVWNVTGRQKVTLELAAPTGQVIRFLGPDGKLHENSVFEKLASTESIITIASPPIRPSVADVSPNEPNGPTDSGSRSARVIGALAAGDGFLYSVSKTAGVWRSINGAACNS